MCSKYGESCESSTADFNHLEAHLLCLINFQHLFIHREGISLSIKIAIAGMAYVGLANCILLAQQNEVTILDIIPKKSTFLNQHKSRISDLETEV